MVDLFAILFGLSSLVVGVAAIRRKRIWVWEWFYTLHDTPAVVLGSIIAAVGVLCLVVGAVRVIQ